MTDPSRGGIEIQRARLRTLGWVEQVSGTGRHVGWRAPDGRQLAEESAILELVELDSSTGTPDVA